MFCGGLCKASSQAISRPALPACGGWFLASWIEFEQLSRQTNRFVLLQRSDLTASNIEINYKTENSSLIKFVQPIDSKNLLLILKLAQTEL
jgi:hypothetical protein